MGVSERTTVGVAAGALCLAGAWYLLDKEVKRWRRVRQHLDEFQQTFLLPLDQLVRIRDDFLKEAQAGLRGDKSSLLMMPTMVDVVPTGDEEGEYFAVDIGGTNYRVIYVKLSERKSEVARFEMEDFAIPEEYYSCPAESLFDLLADSLLAFARRLGCPLDRRAPPVGFCFSFPVNQTAVAAGRVATLTKKFSNEGLVGADPVQMLQAALGRLKAPFKVVALLNDSVGTLAGGAYEDPNVRLGIILGTGTNACYVERVAKLGTLDAELHFTSRPEMLVNTEWGNFFAASLPLTKVDEEVDADTPNAGQYRFEKMVSGLYMGEVARRVILHLAEEAELFGASVPDELRRPWALGTPAMSKMDQDASWALTGTAAALADAFGLPPARCTYFVCSQVKAVCGMVARRSASLAAAAIAGLLRQMERDGSSGAMVATTVCVDGGVFEHYTSYRAYVRAYLDLLLGQQVSALVELKQIRDASSMGSAYLAAAVEAASSDNAAAGTEGAPSSAPRS